MARPLGVLLLVVILTIWNPASLALQAASIVWNIGSRPTLSIAFLAARLLITSVGVAAGLALWLRRPGAVWLAEVSLVLFAVEAVVRRASTSAAHHPALVCPSPSSSFCTTRVVLVSPKIPSRPDLLWPRIANPDSVGPA